MRKTTLLLRHRSTFLFLVAFVAVAPYGVSMDLRRDSPVLSPEESSTPIVQDDADAQQDEIQWKSYSKEKHDQALDSGSNILVVAVADWCGTCQGMLQTTFKDPILIEAIVEKKIVPLMLNITDLDEPETAWMEELEINAVPTMILVPGDQPETKQRIVGLQPVEDLLKQIEELSVGMQTDK